MIDGNGRTIDYLRISITDRCNLRCIYCMPEAGVETVPHKEILSYEEILRLAKLFASLGFRKVRLTGGEPLLRKGAEGLIYELKQISGIEQVTVTTNGIALAEAMDGLAKAGVDGINLSLDTLNPRVFQRITRRDSFDKVIEGFHQALKYPEIPMKINCVPMGIPGQDVLELAELARKYPVHVRYIEMMPIGLGKQFEFSGEDALLEALVKRYGEADSCKESLGNGPAHYYSFQDFKGAIGFISAMSHKFCGSCNRVRLTSQGYLKSCLQYDIGTDLKKLLRLGACDEELRFAIKETILQKPEGHEFDIQPKIHGEKHLMAQIGG